MHNVNNPLDPDVTRLVEAGAPIGDAVRIVLAKRLGVPSKSGVSEFARKYSMPRANTSASIHGKRPAPDDVLNALVNELGSTAEEWAERLYPAAKPAALSA